MSIGLGPKVHIFAVPYQTNSNMVASATALRWRLDRFCLLFVWFFLSLCSCFGVCVFLDSLPVQVLHILLSSSVGFLLRRVQK